MAAGKNQYKKCLTVILCRGYNFIRRIVSRFNQWGKRQMKKAIVGILAVICCVIIYSCGGGGGAGGGGTTVSPVGYEDLSGFVQLPRGVSMSREAGRSAAVSGLNNIENVSVTAYVIDDTGTGTQMIDSAMSNERGYFDLDVPESVEFSKNLLLTCGSGSNLMRAFAIDGETDLTPVSEHIVEQVLGSTYGLSAFSDDEIEKIETYLEQAATDFEFDQYTSVDAAITAFNTGQVASNTTMLIQQMGSGTYSGISCGNGIMEPGEECDHGSSNTLVPCTPGEYNSPCNYCTPDCVKIIKLGDRCGDGTIQSEQGEACDDGNLRDNDGCSSTCVCEAENTCGDGLYVEGCNNEECDDGNNNDEDGCSATCETE